MNMRTMTEDDREEIRTSVRLMRMALDLLEHHSRLDEMHLDGWKSIRRTYNRKHKEINSILSFIIHKEERADRIAKKDGKPLSKILT